MARKTAKTIGFRASEEDEAILEAATGPGETVTDVIRRALRLLAHEAWLVKAREDAARLADENLSDEPDAW